jgi:hypothetical protein
VHRPPPFAPASKLTSEGVHSCPVNLGGLIRYATKSERNSTLPVPKRTSLGDRKTTVCEMKQTFMGSGMACKVTASP